MPLMRMFFLFVGLAVAGFTTSVVFHIRAMLGLLPEPQQPGVNLILKWWWLPVALAVANSSILALEQFWDGARFAQFLNGSWAFLRGWAKGAIALFILHLIGVAALEIHWLRASSAQFRICKQGGKYWSQQIRSRQTRTRMDNAQTKLT
jgi:hypothetical protein